VSLCELLCFYVLESVFWLFIPWLGVYACSVMFGLEGLSPLGVWDVLGGWTHDGHGTG